MFSFKRLVLELTLSKIFISTKLLVLSKAIKGENKLDKKKKN